ncbi:MAG: hypothetical protein JL50_03035 [Peptococcaceae bacterium BICA1-7]|nr:MAG: hypothetical protein JL50_03035 [Peptococcaceae bacterium BICA1-7]HBV97761.1 hypothetical protein [Desulfotomaculum sp.]
MVNIFDVLVPIAATLLISGYIGFTIGQNNKVEQAIPGKLKNDKGEPLLIRLELFGEVDTEFASVQCKRQKSLDFFRIAEIMRNVAVYFENEGIEKVNSAKVKKSHLRLVK